MYADLLAREQQRARHAETLSEAALSLSQTTTPGALLGELSRLACDLLGCSGITVYQVDTELQRVRLAYIGSDYAPELERAIHAGLQSPGNVARLLAGSEGYFGDLETPESIAYLAALGVEPPPGVRALVRIPLVAEGRLRGGLTLRFSDPQEFPEAERALLRDFATYAAIAIRNAEQFESERRARALAEAATRLSGIWLSSPSRDRCVNDSLAIIDEALPGAGRAIAVVSIDGLELRWVAARGSLSPLAGVVVSLATHPDHASDEKLLRQLLEANGMPGAAQLTLLEAAGQLQGILCSTPDADSFRGTFEELRTLAAPLTVGVANMRLEEAERERHARERMMATALANMDQAVLIVGLDRRVRFANGAAIKEYGFAGEEFIGLSLDQLVDTAAAARRLGSPAMEATGVWVAEHVHARKDGSRFPASVLISYIRDHNNIPVGQVLTIRNLSEEQRIQQQLRQSEKLAALGELVAGVAHELNNPLAGISAFAQLLMEDQLPVEQHDSIRLIKREADRAVGVIRDLLLFSRKSGPTLAEVSVNEMVELTLRLRGYALRSAGIDVRLDLEPDLPPISGDAPRLQQVLLNLIVNAEHALSHAELKRLVVRSTRNESTVVVIVSDSGIGMDDATRERIFEPFFTTKPAGEGTGLGLSVSYGIVRAHGGHLYVESKPGVGTTFRLEFPVATVPLAVSA